jgi:hypothetical protein
MEKNMQIFTSELNPAGATINHNVQCDWDDKGNLHFVEQDTGEGVKQIWRTDKYEYFFTVINTDVMKFIQYCFWKGFTFQERMTVKILRDMCDELEIKYETDYWM